MGTLQRAVASRALGDDAEWRSEAHWIIGALSPGGLIASSRFAAGHVRRAHCHTNHRPHSNSRSIPSPSQLMQPARLPVPPQLFAPPWFSNAASHPLLRSILRLPGELRPLALRSFHSVASYQQNDDKTSPRANSSGRVIYGSLLKPDKLRDGVAEAASFRMRKQKIVGA
jgi:hypothetical protein